jgi:hypothetical protein
VVAGFLSKAPSRNANPVIGTPHGIQKRASSTRPRMRKYTLVGIEIKGLAGEKRGS